MAETVYVIVSGVASHVNVFNRPTQKKWASSVTLSLFNMKFFLCCFIEIQTCFGMFKGVELSLVPNKPISDVFSNHDINFVHASKFN